MEDRKLTDAELMLLGLVAEMPRHGYELEQVIEDRGMRSWTHIGFSSIYFVLGKLEKMGFIAAKKPKGLKAKKQFSVTDDGEIALRIHSLSALENIEIMQSGLLLGMLHWPFLPAAGAIEALQRRAEKLQARIDQLERERFRRQPLPDYVDRVFDAKQGQLRTEAEWVEQTKRYFSSHLELDDKDGL